MEEQTAAQLLKKFLAFYRTSKFTIVLTKERTIRTYSVIYESRLRLQILSRIVFFFQVFRLTFRTLKFYINFHLSRMLSTCSTHLSLPNIMILMASDDEYRLCSSQLCTFVHSPVTHSLSWSYRLLVSHSARTLIS